MPWPIIGDDPETRGSELEKPRDVRTNNIVVWILDAGGHLRIRR
jgi:hypothetical protein